jgi:acetylglutamate kinase
VRILVKIGGAQLEEPEPRAELCRAVAAARKAGHECVLVHGAGKQIKKVGASLGLQDRYHQGLRITDDATAEVVLMVLGGAVNRSLVAALQEAGVPSVGLTGADGGTFAAKKLRLDDGFELGHVGAVAAVRPALVETLLAAGYVPVIASVAPGPSSHAPFFNVNADHAVAPLAKAFRCEAVLFLTDVPGVLDAKGQLLPQLTPEGCDELMDNGVAKGGMLPKLESALLAANVNPKALVKIATASGADSVLAALRAGTGTRFLLHAGAHPEETAHG